MLSKCPPETLYALRVPSRNLLCPPDREVRIVSYGTDTASGPPWPPLWSLWGKLRRETAGPWCDLDTFQGIRPSLSCPIRLRWCLPTPPQAPCCWAWGDLGQPSTTIPTQACVSDIYFPHISPHFLLVQVKVASQGHIILLWKYSYITSWQMVRKLLKIWNSGINLRWRYYLVINLN